MALPAEVVGHQFGPQLTALIACLTVICRMPRLVVQRFLGGVLHGPIGLGSTHAAGEEASAAVARAEAELAAALSTKPCPTRMKRGIGQWREAVAVDLCGGCSCSIPSPRRGIGRADDGPPRALRRLSRQRSLAQLSHVRRSAAPTLQ